MQASQRAPTSDVADQGRDTYPQTDTDEKSEQQWNASHVLHTGILIAILKKSRKPEQNAGRRCLSSLRSRYSLSSTMVAPVPPS